VAVVFMSYVNLCQASENPIEITFLGVSVQERAERLLEFLLSIIGSIAFLFLIGSGIFYITSNGNPDSQNKAKKMLISTLIGLFVVSFSYILIILTNRLLTE